jgi:hypothetical protein
MEANRELHAPAVILPYIQFLVPLYRRAEKKLETID